MVPPLEDSKLSVADDKCDPIPETLTSKPTGRKAWDKCLEYQKLVFPCGFHHNYHAIPPSSGWDGYSRSNRCHHTLDTATEGEDARPMQFPHMALLAYGNETELKWQCAGSLISDQFVMTTAYCIKGWDGNPVSFVQLGTHIRSVLPARGRFRVIKTFTPPDYKPPHKYNDIALLQLEEPVPLDESMVPACIHTGEEVDYRFTFVTGWRYQRGKQETEILHEKLMTFVNINICSHVFRPNRILKDGLNPNSQSCFAPPEETREVCQAESGSPLQIKNKKIACMYTILGVTSFGKRCGYSLPIVFTNVKHYADWIEATVWP